MSTYVDMVYLDTPKGEYMTIIFYANNSERIRLTKNLTEIARMEGSLREPTSLVDPVITIQYNSVVGYNYCYIPEFERYYFISDIVSIRTGLVELHCHVDVLSTYKEAIRTLNAVVSRNEIDYDGTIIDERAIFGQYSEHELAVIPEAFQYTKNMCEELKYCAVLTTVTSVADPESVTRKGYGEVTQPTGLIHYGAYIEPTYLYKKKYMLFETSGDVYNWLEKNSAKDDKFASSIISYISFPMNLWATPTEESKYNYADYDEDTHYIYVGEDKFSFEVPGTVVALELNSPTGRTFHIFDTNIKSFIGITSYLFYALKKPFSIFQLYLPYYGWVDIPNEFIYLYYNDYIHVDYCINDENGMCSAYIYISGDKKITIKTITFQLGLKFSFSYTNQVDIENQRAETMLSKGLGFITGALQAVAGGATGNGVAVAGGFAQMGASIGTGITELNQERTVGGGSAGDDTYLNYFGDNRCIFRWLFRKPLYTSKDADYRKLRGAPCNKYLSFENISGYTEISDIHLEGEQFKNATTSELSELENALKKGAIF